VFDRFRQADASAAHNYGGLGLGLAIVRHLVELHGGTVKAQSAEGEGATFWIELPIRATPAATGTDDHGLSGAEPAQTGGEPLRGRRVLVVDADADARQLIAA